MFDSTFNQVRGTLVEIRAIGAEKVTMEARIMEDLEATAVQLPQIMMAVEEDFGISLPDGAGANLHTVGDLVNDVDSQLPSE